MPFSPKGTASRWRRLTEPLRIAESAIRGSPAVLLAPLLLFALCVTGGVVAVKYAAASYAAAEREKAVSLLSASSTVCLLTISGLTKPIL